MHLRKSIVAGMVVAATVLLPAGAANASTVSPTPAPVTTTIHTSMVVKGYDAQVAEANGYKIVTNADGTQQSVPVTSAAIAQQAKSDQLRAAAQATTQIAASSAGGVVCGDSWVSGAKLANNTVAFHTGFLVYGAASYHVWTVYAVGTITANSWATSGSGPYSGTQSWEGGISTVIGPGVGGVPFLSPAASVVLENGSICFSVGPTFTFG